MMARMDGNGLIIPEIPMHIDLVDDLPSREINDQNQIDEVQQDSVSGLNKTLTKDVKYLCIFDIVSKLKISGDYDIGGTYDSEPELWFYFTTSVCPGYNYLLSLFVTHRKTGNCFINISNSNKVISVNNSSKFTGRSELPETMQACTIRSIQENTNHYIKTFCFSQNDLEVLENTTLFIPVKIETGVAITLDPDVIRRIKLEHDFGNLLADKEKMDFVIQSRSGKKFDAHKIILVAHSPVLRNSIKTLTKPLLQLDIMDAEVEILLEFMYTGTIKELFNMDSLKMLEIADKFQLENLFRLVQYAIGRQIRIDNAVDIVVLSEKYNLVDLQNQVLKFIKNNPPVLETEGWLKLDNVQLTKKMFKFLYNSSK